MKYTVTNKTIQLSTVGSAATDSTIISLQNADSLGIVAAPSGTFTNGSATLQVANDRAGPFITVGSALTFTAGTAQGFTLNQPAFGFAKIVAQVATGTMALSLQTLVKSNNPQMLNTVSN